MIPFEEERIIKEPERSEIARGESQRGRKIASGRVI
jgi:hypothetical protein